VKLEDSIVKGRGEVKVDGEERKEGGEERKSERTESVVLNGVDRVGRLRLLLIT
jgi:hypothetical protein